MADRLSSRNSHDQLCVHPEGAQVGHQGGQQQIRLALGPADLALSHAEPFSELHLRYLGCVTDGREIDHQINITLVLYVFQVL